MHTWKHFAALFSLFLICSPFDMRADSANAKGAEKCACGCLCGPGCTCGCSEGNPCHCPILDERPKGCCPNPCCNPTEPAYNPENEAAYVNACGLCGVWFPEGPTLFRPFAADPREICYSAGWRRNDEVFYKDIIDVSFGDIIGIYQWCDVGPWHGKLRLELEGAVWAIFAPLQESSPLINADYFVGVPITYAFDNWSFRLRGYHISSHIGDEFLLQHQCCFKRKNPSAEYLDFFVSNMFTPDLRLFAGVGWVFLQDETFKISPFYAAAGFELRPDALKTFYPCNRMYGVPFLATYFRYSSDFKHHVDGTYALGYEWGKLYGLERRLRVFLEYHHGYSVEGQFCKLPTNYYSIRASYGF